MKNRSDSNRGEFAATAEALFERLRDFYAALRERFPSPTAVRDAFSTWPVPLREGPFLRNLVPPPLDLRPLVSLAGRVGDGAHRLLDLPAERGRTASSGGGELALHISLADRPTRSWFGGGGRREEVELLDLRFLSVLYGRGRGGPVATAQAVCGVMLGRTARAIGELIKAFRIIRRSP